MRTLNPIEMNAVSGGGITINGGMSGNTGSSSVGVHVGIGGSASGNGKGGNGVGIVIPSNTSSTRRR